MTKEDFPYWSEEETMNFLNYNETSMVTLRKSKALTRYKIGHRFFYDKKEIISLIEASKVYDQDTNQYQKYIAEITKQLSRKELNGLERRFVLIYAKHFLDYMQKLIPETHRLTNRDKLILDMCFANLKFKDVAERFNISSERVAQIFQKTLRITSRLCYEMKNNYDNNYIPLQEENELLKKQNHQLKSDLLELNKNSKVLEEYTDSVLYTPIWDLDISVRIMNVLRINNVMTLGDIIKYERNDFLRFRNFGVNSLTELIEMLDFYGLKLKGRK
jgi:hypothetical protein